MGIDREEVHRRPTGSAPRINRSPRTVVQGKNHCHSVHSRQIWEELRAFNERSSLAPIKPKKRRRKA
jgi:hypothetical protein